jgi:hypothetical protein
MLPQSGISQVGCRQPKFEIIPVHFDVSEHVDGGALGLVEGKYALTVTKTGNGDFTFTLNSPGRRACILVGSPVAVGTVDARVMVHADTSASLVRLVSEVGGTDTDMDLMFAIGVYRDEKQR